MTEKGSLVWEDGEQYFKINNRGEIVPNKLIWVPNERGMYEKVIGWEPKEMNNVYEKNGYFFPNGSYAIRIGCDPFKYDKTKDNRKSDCAAYAFQAEDLLDKENPYNEMFVMNYVNRASTTDMQYNDVLKMAWYCGCQILFERNVDGWKKYLQTEKCSGFYMWLPNEVEPGVYTDGQGNTVQMICDFTEAYIEKSIKKVYFESLLSQKRGWLGFAVEDTQKSDDTMAAGFAFIAWKSKKYTLPRDSKKNVESIMPYNKAI
jgi:hypothetical protein